MWYPQGPIRARAPSVWRWRCDSGRIKLRSATSNRSGRRSCVLATALSMRMPMWPGALWESMRHGNSRPQCSLTDDLRAAPLVGPVEGLDVKIKTALDYLSAGQDLVVMEGLAPDLRWAGVGAIWTRGRRADRRGRHGGRWLSPRPGPRQHHADQAPVRPAADRGGRSTAARRDWWSRSRGN